MKCKIDGCERDSSYISQQVCQMHYFRFMRNGTYEKKRDILLRETGLTRKYRITNPAGYQKLYEPSHPLSNKKDGYVYEHRFVAYEKYGDVLPNCALCGTGIDWSNAHIDHIDEDVSNNKIDNLRPLCRGCNTSRVPRLKNVMSMTIDGVTDTVINWARRLDCTVSYATIMRRLKAGYSPYDALYSKSLTHPNKVAKKPFRKLSL